MDTMGKIPVMAFHAGECSEHWFDFHWIRTNGDGEIYGFLSYPNNGKVLPGTGGFYRTEDLDEALCIARTFARRWIYNLESAPHFPSKIGKAIPA